jgi:hypothetical protein
MMIPGPEGWPLPTDLKSGELFHPEWNTFCRELTRLLAEGNEGRWAVMRGDEIVGVWDTEGEALTAGYERCGQAPFLLQPITREERPVRAAGNWWCQP